MMMVSFAPLIPLLLAFPSWSDANDINNNGRSMMNRQLSASISSSTWPTTPTSPLCEAYSYLDSSPSTERNDNLFYSNWKLRYLSSLSESNAVISTYEDGIQLALTAARESFPLVDNTGSSESESETPDKKSQYNSSLDSNLISFALATRAHSPQCEMYRKLSHHAISFLNRGDNNNNAFVVVGGTKQVYASVSDLKLSFVGNKDSSIKKEVFNDAWANIVPKEEIFFDREQIGDNGDGTKSTLILYGKFHTKEFAEFFKYLKDQEYSFVVRYMSDTNIANDNIHEQTNDTNVEMKTTLQGYGVRVDIRNLEYKSFDEKDTKEEYKYTKKENEIQGDVAQDTLNIDVVKEKWINGIDPELLKSHSSSQELQSFLKRYMLHFPFTDLENYHVPVIPPRSELKDISLAATTVISQSEDPLWTLTQLSQNLPSHAYALCNVTIPFELRSIAKKQMANMPMVRRSQEDGISQFYINGRRMSIARPSFNLFELLNVLREENSFLKSIHTTMKDYLPSKEAMNEALSLLSMGKDDIVALADSDDNREGGQKNMPKDMEGDEKSKTLRIDVGRGGKGAILYLNDIEKDSEYQNWPNDVQQALMNIQFGRPPTMRRNLMTVLIVLDPFDSYKEDYLQAMGMFFQMMQGMYPVRIGILFANQKDIDDCRQSLSSTRNANCNDELQYCLDKRYDADNEEVLKQKVSTQAIYSLLKTVKDTHGGAIALNYLYGVMQSFFGENTSKITIKNLFKTHNKTLKMMGMPPIHSDSELIEHLKSLESESATATYEKAVRFASAKNIKPGMAFMNGIPFSVDDPSKAQSVVQDEINEIVRMIVVGEITNSRKSVYAKFLTGPNVYKQMHPLLNEPHPNYHLISSYFDTRTMVFANSESDGKSQLPKVLFEAFADFTNDEGMELTESFLSSIKRKVELSKKSDQAHIAFRVLPSDTESAGTMLGQVFGNANKFGIDNLLTITKSFRKALVDGKDVTSDTFLSEFEDSLKDLLKNILKEEPECSFLPWEKDLSGSILVNGRLLKADKLSFEDIEILFDLEYKTAKVITNRLTPLIEGGMDTFVAITRLISFIGNVHSDIESRGIKRTDALAPYRHLIHNPPSNMGGKNWFYHTWKGDSDSTSDEPKVRHSFLKHI